MSNLDLINKITILISHDSRDEKIAYEVKSFLQAIFLNVSVYVSGRDLVGGEIWIEQIKNQLKSSRVIVSLLTRKSLGNTWVYFESGAGFTEDKTIPLLTDNLKTENLTAPLRLLQARLLTETGIGMFIKDISKKLGVREPESYPNIKDLLRKIEKLLRSENTLQLKNMLPKNKIAPNAIAQWIYMENCLVHDFEIENKYRIAVDTYFYMDKTEIQLFAKSGADGYFFDTMCKTENFLPKLFDQYELKGNRLIFQNFDSNENLETVAKYLTDLLSRIEDYKNKTDKV